MNETSIYFWGGLGNNIFQIATILSHSKKYNLKPVFYHWDIPEILIKKNPVPNITLYEKFGGHNNKDNLSINDIFPNLPWHTNINNECPYNLDISYFTYHHHRYIPIKYINKNTIYWGYFFSYSYWHNERDYILKMLAPNIEKIKYIESKYHLLFDNNNSNISLHNRNINNDLFKNAKILIEKKINHQEIKKNYKLLLREKFSTKIAYKKIFD